MDRARHWEQVFETKNDADVSWYQESPQTSLDLIEACGVGTGGAVVDAGAGSSSLVDHLVLRGYEDVTALDISAAALARSKARLGASAEQIHWIVCDVTSFRPERRYHLWHDRAAFHFLTDEADRQAYADVLEAAVAPGGWVVLAAFAPHGPTRCSGLDVQRHDGASMAAVLGPSFALVEEHVVEHITPSGAAQPFTFARFRRIPEQEHAS